MSTALKIRIVYKSGYVHDFEVLTFVKVNDEFFFERHAKDFGPLDIGGDEIAAIWQMGTVTYE